MNSFIFSKSRGSGTITFFMSRLRMRARGTRYWDVSPMSSPGNSPQVRKFPRPSPTAAYVQVVGSDGQQVGDVDLVDEVVIFRRWSR